MRKGLFVALALGSAFLLSSCLQFAPEAPQIYRADQLEVCRTCTYDLDTGAESPRSGADLWWRFDTDVERYLVPMNGAKFSLLGNVNFEAIDFKDLLFLLYSSNPINGSDNEDNQIPTGTVVAYITDEGRYGKFRVDSYGETLELTFVTYEKVP
ncbi:hypothetical protein ACVNPS_00750 [Candidatus Bipolaricaulota sp. J31]